MINTELQLPLVPITSVWLMWTLPSSHWTPLLQCLDDQYQASHQRKSNDKHSCPPPLLPLVPITSVWLMWTLPSSPTSLSHWTPLLQCLDDQYRASHQRQSYETQLSTTAGTDNICLTNVDFAALSHIT
ncbi:hypothetical protein J6590_007558 [Homalodisca vitripennis]|nr:hypothetical protein J6590_007558 [Homalodisca vitripennis]